MTTTHGCCCRDSHITMKQCQVIAMIASGLSNRQIGTRLYLSTFTVDKVVAALLQRMAVHNRAELTSAAYHYGILRVSDWPPRCVERRCLSAPNGDP